MHSLLSHVPIEELDTVRAHYQKRNLKIRVRYRGPRRKDAHGKTTYNGRLECLKKDATHFAVYRG